MMSRFFFRWAGWALFLGLTGCGLIDPVGTTIKKLKDPAAAVRCAAIEKLRLRHDARAVDPLIACLGDSDMNVREAATQALGDLNDSRAIEPLIACLPTDDTDLRKATITALGKLDHAQVGERLVVILQNKNTNAAMASGVIEALGDLHYPPAVDALLPFLADKNDGISSGATNALSQIGAPAFKPLIACLKDPKAQVRGQAAEALGQIGDGRAVEPLIACLKHPGADQNAAGGQDMSNGEESEDQKNAREEEDSQVRQKAAEALGKLGQPAVAPLIVCLVESSGKDSTDEENPEKTNLYESLISALTDLGEPVIKPLTVCLNDKNLPVQEAAAAVLDKLHYLPPNPEGKAAFFILLQSWDQLVGLGAPAVPPLLDCLKDTDASRRQGAVEALGQLGDKRAVEPLIACLQDDRVEVKKNAATALGQLGDKRAVKALIDAFKNEGAETRLAAAEALGLLGSNEAVAPLAAALTDEDAGLRQVCAQALDKLNYQPQKVEDRVTYLIAIQAWDKLAKIGAPAIEPLSACLSDQNTDVQQGAIEALGNLGDKRAIAPLHAALPDWNLNASLVPALEQLGWKPASDSEQVYDWIGKKDSDHLKQNWEKTRKVLLDDVSSGDRRKIQNAVYSFVALGDPKVVDDLVQALNDHGDQEMAETYLNCSNDRLEQAAHDWAANNGYQTISIPTGSTPMHWGSW
jgi:HEAT repeat protein